MSKPRVDDLVQAAERGEVQPPEQRDAVAFEQRLVTDRPEADEPAPAAPKTKRQRAAGVAKGGAVSVVWLVLFGFALVGSAAYHLSTDLMRGAVADVLNQSVSGLIAGRLYVDRIEELTPWRIVVRDAALFDGEGHEVLRADSLVLVPDLAAARGGVLRFSHAELREGHLTLIDSGDGIPTFITSFDPIEPSEDEGEPFHAIVDDLHVEDVSASGEVLGLGGLEVENLVLHGRLEFFDEVDIQIFSGSADVLAPFETENSRVERLSGRIRSERHEGTRLYAEVSAEGPRGPEHARANIVYALPREADASDEEAIEELDILVQAAPISAESIVGLGYEWAGAMQGPITGYLRLFGPPTDLRMRANLETEGGPVQVAGALPAGEDVVVTLRTDGVDAGRVLSGFPELPVRGEVTIRVGAGDDGEATRMTLDLEPFVYDTFAIPTSRVELALEDDGFRIESVELPYGDGEINAEGHVGYDGSLDLRAQGHLHLARDPNIQRYLPGARGRAEVDMTVRGTADDVRIRGRWRLSNVRYGPVVARTLDARGTLAGDLAAPSVDLTIDGAGVEVSGVPLGNGQATVSGGPSAYVVSTRFRHHDVRTEAGARIELEDGSMSISADHLLVAVKDVVWRGNLSRLGYRGGALDVSGFRMSSGPQSVNASGTWRRRGDDQFRAEVRGFDLATLETLLERELDVAGRLSADIGVMGDVEQAPSIRIEHGSIEDGRAYGFDGMSSSFQAAIGGGQVSGDVSVTFVGHGSITANLAGVVEPLPDLVDSLATGVYEGDVTVQNFDLVIARRAVQRWPDLTGRVNGTAHVSGAVGAPSFRGRFEVEEMGLPEPFDPISVASAFSYDYGTLSARVMTGDDFGELVEAEGTVVIDVPTVVRQPALLFEMLEASPWRISARVPPRRVDTMPAPVRDMLPASLGYVRTSASLTLSGGMFMTQGELRSTLDWTGDLSDHLCGTEAAPRASITARLTGDETVATIRGMIADRVVLRGRANATTPVHDWLVDTSRFVLPAITFRGQLDDVPIETIPFACEYARGNVHAEVAGHDLLTAAPTIEVSIESDGLRARKLLRAPSTGAVLTQVETVPFEVTMQLRIDSEQAGGRLRFVEVGGEAPVALVEASLPIQWSEEAHLPDIDLESTLDARAEFAEFPMQAALSWVPTIGDVEGVISGTVTANGPVANPHLDGSVQVADGGFSLESVGQRLSGVTGTVAVEDGRAKIEDFQARDGDGVATINGAVELSGIVPVSSDIEIVADAFPIRQEGTVVAALTGQSHMSTTFVEGGMTANLTVDRLDVRVPAEGMRAPQDLAPHADVSVVGHETQLAETVDPYVLNLHVDAEDPFQVRSQDYSAMLTASLDVRYVDPEFHVGGSVDLRRGFFEVFGKRFDVSSGTLNFNIADEGIDPLVDLTAVHPLRSPAGESVTVNARGRLSNLDVRFTSTVTNDKSEIIALLVGGGQRSANVTSQNAQQEAADFVAGIAAGVLTLTLREEFGEYMPLFAVEATSHGARIRAGYNFDHLLPDVLRSVVRGFYIEGYYTTDRDDDRTTGRRQTGGFLMELQFPRNIVGTGTFAPPNNWAIDFTWEP